MQAAIDAVIGDATNSDIRKERPAPAVKHKAGTRAARSKPRARPAPAGA
jgi:hypothetical protein